MPPTERTNRQTAKNAPLPPELVQKVVEKVYAMLLADLRLEAERSRQPAVRGTGRRLKGGR